MNNRRDQSSILALAAILTALLALVCGGIGWYTVGPTPLSSSSHAWDACLVLGGLSAISLTLSVLFAWDDITIIIEQERRDAHHRRSAKH